MVSLAELKTGKEKLELINQILLRIDTIARALDNTRLDEIVGLKESVNSLHEQTLELKQEVLTMYTSFSENKKDFDTKFSSVNEKFSIMQERFSFIEQAYNDFSSSKEELELIKGFIEENKPVFESLKDDLSKYESMKIDLEAIITEATNNTKLSKEYFELSSKIKDDILRELEHCKDLVQELNYSADELRGLKPELLQIKKEVNELSSQASKVVLDASEIIKNKINTIFFENQRLNQEMIDSVKKLEEIKYDVGIKYKEIIQAYNLLLETKESLEELKEVIALYKEFENDIKSYSELIKNFKEQIANLESDLENKAQGLHEALEAKGEQVISSIETAKNEAIIKFDELVAKCEGYKIHFEQSYDRFNQRALIANEDLGRLAEVAKKELGNDKLIYETELKALRDEILQEMNEVSDKVINDSTGVIASIDEKANELKDFIDISRVNIDNLINAFNANYNQKIQEFTSLNTNALRSIEEAKTSSLSDINTSKDESLSSIETSKDNALRSIEEAKTQGIASIDEKITQIDFNGIKERVEKNEGDIAGIEKSLEDKAVLLTRSLEWTVGNGGKFTDLQTALDEALKYASNQYSITIELLNGFKFDKSYKNYRFDCLVYITSKNREVQVDASKLDTTKSLFNNIVGICLKECNLKLINFDGSTIYSVLNTCESIGYRHIISHSTFVDFSALTIYCKGILYYGVFKIESNILSKKVYINQTANSNDLTHWGTVYELATQLCVMFFASLGSKIKYRITSKITNDNSNSTLFYTEAAATVTVENTFRHSDFSFNGNIYSKPKNIVTGDGLIISNFE